ncbi:MAG: hypothetical protein IIC52_13220 [Proteobacteria bacterium]|nr:hypothetical protein [Pseudomonadota bacterium]
MKTNRRNVIKLGAAAAVASVIPMTAGAAQEDGEIIRAFNAWAKAHERAEAAWAASGVAYEQYIATGLDNPPDELVEKRCISPGGNIWIDAYPRNELAKVARRRVGAKRPAWEVGREQARLEALYDQWASAKKAKHDELVQPFSDRADREDGVATALLRALALAKPTSLHGVALKLIAAVAWCAEGCSQWGVNGEVIDDAAADALRITGIEKPAVAS